MLYKFYFFMSFVCHSYVIRISSVCVSHALKSHLHVTHMASVCHSYVFVCHPYVIRMSFVSHSYMVLPWTLVMVKSFRRLCLQWSRYPMEIIQHSPKNRCSRRENFEKLEFVCTINFTFSPVYQPTKKNSWWIGLKQKLSTKFMDVGGIVIHVSLDRWEIV